MTVEHPPIRILRLVLITLILLGAITMLVPEEPHTASMDAPVDTLAARTAAGPAP